MSKVIQTLSAIASNKSSSPMLDAFEREGLTYYPIDPTIEPEIKLLWNTQLQTIHEQVRHIFSAFTLAQTHNKQSDHFIYIPKTIEHNNYDLTSFAMDTYKRSQRTGGPIPTMQITKSGHQARLRLAIAAASKEKQFLEELRSYYSPDTLSKHPVQRLSPNASYGAPEYSIKTSLTAPSQSDNKSLFRREFEAKVGGAMDVLGVFLEEMGDKLPAKLRKLLISINSDPNVFMGVMAACMTRRISYDVAHYLKSFDAYVLYENTLDHNKFCSPRTARVCGEDIEQESEALTLFPSEKGRKLCKSEQEDILNTSLDSTNAHLKSAIGDLTASPGSKMARATKAVEDDYKQKADELPAYFSKAAKNKALTNFDGKYALMEQVSIHDAMARLGRRYDSESGQSQESESLENFVDSLLFSKP